MIFSDLPPRCARRAFTLVELLVVMAIIAIVIALVLPAIASSRRNAQAADTRNLVTQLTNAVSSFVNDERKTPGYFSEREMGSADNSTNGMSSMENLMLDLYGYQPATGAGSIRLQPMNGGTYLDIDPTLIGTPGQGSKQYFVPNKKFYVAQNAGTQQMASAPYASSDGDPRQLPDVVDSFGTPLLAWRMDDTYITKPGLNNGYTFARSDSGAGNQKAKFYWASNACFLKATQTGKRVIDQRYNNPNLNGSTIGEGAPTLANSLAGALGSPNDPYRDPANLTAIPVVARSPRGSVTIQSAGVDGVYFGRNDPGSKKQFNLAAPGAIYLDYKINFVPNLLDLSLKYTDKDGHPTNHDILGSYDDIIGTAGN